MNILHILIIKYRNLLVYEAKQIAPMSGEIKNELGTQGHWGMPLGLLSNFFVKLLHFSYTQNTLFREISL